MAGVDHGIKSQEFSFVPRFRRRQNRALNHVHANPSCGKISPTGGYSRPEWNSAGDRRVSSRQKFKIQPPLLSFFSFFLFFSPSEPDNDAAYVASFSVCFSRSSGGKKKKRRETENRRTRHVRAAFPIESFRLVVFVRATRTTEGNDSTPS